MNTTINYRQVGRDVKNAESGAMRTWLSGAVAIREAGPRESAEYEAARAEAAEGYVERGGSANTFKSRLSDCNVILDHFVGQSPAELAKLYPSIPKAKAAAEAGVAAGEAAPAKATTKSAAEYEAGARAAIRLALGAGVTTDELRTIIAEEAAKLA